MSLPAYSSSQGPEQYHIHATTRYVPNSRLPVLVYRSVLPLAPTSTVSSSVSAADAAREIIEKNHWYYGGIFKAYWKHHFHSVTHQCYAVVHGQSRLVLGVGPLEHDRDHDDEHDVGDSDGGRGVRVDLGAGDIIILPAGVSHCSVTSQGDYEYLGLYPEGSPKYDNNYCKAGEKETRLKAETARKVPIPEWDPIFGHKGPFTRSGVMP